MITRCNLVTLVLVLLGVLTAGISVQADDVDISLFQGTWDIDSVSGGPEVLELNSTHFITLKRKSWWPFGASRYAYHFDVKNQSHPFESYIFHVTNRPIPGPAALPACGSIGLEVGALIAQPLNALIGSGTMHHHPAGPTGPEQLDSSLVLFIPCQGTSTTRKFVMVVRSFAFDTGGGVSHNGMIHGIG